jgi:tetratricopeptide (TPR) repeat protein
METMQKSNRFMLVGAGIFGGIGILALVFTAWFVFRAMNRLSEIAATFPMGHALGAPQATVALGAGETRLVGFASGEPPGPRLLGAIERLEKRIHDLENTAQSPSAADNNPGDDNGKNATSLNRADSEIAEKISLLLGKGQALLHMDQPESAVACFEEVLNLEPKHAEALIKKGTALERLKRLEEAIECYDGAIAANNSMTLAYLYKGGVFNQLERFSEALECYEQALRTQQKAVVS